jgi:adenosylcobinamide kinase/adenosylcobinamide-phosphate guanylyltransferase
VIVLIGGGSRSGKSTYALDYARRSGQPLTFIATAETSDEEMQARADAHRLERGPEWTTIEEPIDLAVALSRSTGTVVVDCLTLWLSNLLLGGHDVSVRAKAFLDAAAASPAQIILVTNEVGCGIVPDNALARRFRDLAGRLNQDASRLAEEVYWMVFGCALRLK